MKTDNVYFADAYITTKIENTYELTGYSLFGFPEYRYVIHSKELKKILILYKNKSSENIAIDLNTNIKYGLQVPSRVGKIYIRSESLIPFNSITGNTKANLTKRKIKKIGNQELIKLMKEE